MHRPPLSPGNVPSTVKHSDILEIKNVLVKSVYCVTDCTARLTVALHTDDLSSISNAAALWNESRNRITNARKKCRPTNLGLGFYFGLLLRFRNLTFPEQQPYY